jgi:hypothetical protein
MTRDPELPIRFGADDFVWSCARCELQVFQDAITDNIIGDALSEDCSWPSCLQLYSLDATRVWLCYRKRDHDGQCAPLPDDLLVEMRRLYGLSWFRTA